MSGTPLAAVQTYLDAFNSGDTQAMSDTFVAGGWRVAAWAWAKGAPLD